MLFKPWKILCFVAIFWQNSQAGTDKSCKQFDANKMLETLRIREKDKVVSGLASIENVHEVVLLDIIEQERKAIRYQVIELEKILAARSDIHCLRVVDSCKRRFEFFQEEGIGNCLRLGSVFLDFGALNGFASFIPKGRLLERVTFEGWGSSWRALEEILVKVSENVVNKDTGVVTLEQMINLPELVSDLRVPGLCTLNVSNSSLVMIPHTNCERRRSKIRKAYGINLHGLEERFSAFMGQFDEKSVQGIPPVERFDALNGRIHAALTPAMKRLFRHPDWNHFGSAFEDHNFRKGAIGCALSHLIIWQEMAQDHSLDDHDAFLILEDDTKFVDNFTALWHSRWTTSDVRADTRWDILYLSIFEHNDVYPEVPVWPYVHILDRVGRSFGAGAFAYLIRKKGARTLLETARRAGMAYAIDTFMFHLSHQKVVTSLKYYPYLVNVDVSTSTTHERYVWGDRNGCIVWTKNYRAAAGYNDNAQIKVSITYPLMDSIILPDSSIELKIEETGEKNFLGENICLEVCYALQPIVSRTEPKEAQCIFIFDRDKEVFLDTTAVIAEAKRRDGKVTIHAAAIGYDGTVIPDSAAESVTVTVNLQWLEIVQQEDSLGKVFLVSGDISLDVFLSKHGSDILCVEGYKPCVHLASLPRTLEVVESTDTRASSPRTFTIHSLDGSTILKTTLASAHYSMEQFDVHLLMRQ